MNRTIPYGYTICNGCISVDKDAASTIRGIYIGYLNGKSFAAIAKELTEKKVDYFQGKTAWNKQMVKRILECPMYCGTDKYPKIIDATQFQAVAKLIASKYGGYNTDPRATVLKKRSFCQECGERIWHDVQSKQYRKWRCKKCAKTVLGDESFYQGVTDILNEVIRHPELLDEIESQDTYESEYQLTVKTKEVNQLISSPTVNFDTAFEDILNLASLKYDNCEYDISEELTDTIKRDYLNRKLLEDVDNELIEHTVSHITVDSHGKITIHFINGAKVTAKGETNGSTQNRS